MRLPRSRDVRLSASETGGRQRRRDRSGNPLDTAAPTVVGSWARPARSTRVDAPDRGGRTATKGPMRLPPADTDVPVVPTSRVRPQECSAATSGEARVPEEPLARNGAGTGALLCGLLGLVFMALLPPIGLLLAIVAICLGLVGRARSLRGLATNRGQALAALLCGAISLIVSGVFVITEVVYVVNHPGLIHSISNCAAKARTSKESQACVQRLTKVIQGAG